MNSKPLIIIALLLRLLVMPFFYHPDIKSQYFHFQFLSQGVTNIYEHLAVNKSHLPYQDTFNYLPLTYFTFGSYFALLKPLAPTSLSTWINNWGNFQNSTPDLSLYMFLLKIPYLLADFAIAYLLSKLYSNSKIGLLWLLNPVSLYLIYILGNFDIIPVLLTILSLYFLKLNRNTFAFLALGTAIALKMYPLIFLPFFLFYRRPKIGELAINSLLALLPLALSIAPFLGFVSFWTSFFGSGLTQKILELKLGIIPLFPLAYTLLFLSYLFNRYKFKLPPRILETHLFFVFIFFVALVNFHPQWLLWFLPFILPLVYFSPRFRLPLILSFLFIFAYIALFNDQYLFWGHLTPIDPAFSDVITPYQITLRFSPLHPDLLRHYLHFAFLVPLILLFIPRHASTRQA